MLTRILDTTRIDINNSQIKHELEIDLRRMDHINHEDAPKGTEAYILIVEPSQRTYSSMLYRFRFEIQYGKYDSNKFIPLGEPKKTQSEALPMI